MSEKYILSCDSPTFMVTPSYYDFCTRGLVPVQHYWPIKMDDKCRSIKFAVEWGNNHEEKVLIFFKNSTKTCANNYSLYFHDRQN